MGSVVPTIGQMKMVIRFDRVNKSSDNTGGQNEEYEEWFTTRGYLDQKRSFRSFETGYDASIKTFDLYVYWRNALEADINKDVRVMYEARSFAIDTFDLVDQRRRIYKMTLTEKR